MSEFPWSRCGDVPVTMEENLKLELDASARIIGCRPRSEVSCVVVAVGAGGMG